MKLTRSQARLRSSGFSLLEVMVSLAILGVAVVALFQLFSITLRSTGKAEKVTRALFHARSVLDYAYSVRDKDIEESSDSFDWEGDFRGRREIVLRSSSEDGKAKLFEITATVTWPPSGSLRITGLRSVYEAE